MTWVGKKEVVFCPEDSTTIENTAILAMDKCKHGKFVFVERCRHGCKFIVEGLGVQQAYNSVQQSAENMKNE